VLTHITAEDEQEDAGVDELYLVVDHVRFPNQTLDDWWDFDDGDSASHALTVASRVRGIGPSAGLEVVRIEAWEDDHETWNEWLVDDLLLWHDLDLGACADGDQLSVVQATEDWDYRLLFEVEVELFADPDPLADSDRDGDGIRDSDEYAVSRDLGGNADPWRREVFVEVDWMEDHELHTNAVRLVTTQYYRPVLPPRDPDVHPP
jgi:hypothetical protein